MCARYGGDNKNVSCGIISQFTHLMMQTLHFIVLVTNEIHSSYNQFLFHSFLSALRVSNESSRSKHVEQTKKCGIKIDYKNCASRWLLTHCNMMHGTHNVKTTLQRCNAIIQQ